MKEWPKDLLTLFDDPIFDNVQPKSPPITANDRCVKTLLEITKWINEHGGKMPGSNGDINEKILARNLKALRRNPSNELKTYDSLNLLER